jgi:hypothetical protein
VANDDNPQRPFSIFAPEGELLSAREQRWAARVLVWAWVLRQAAAQVLIAASQLSVVVGVLRMVL